MDIDFIAERYAETRGCRVKKPYSTKKFAKMAVRNLKRVGSSNIRPYKCRYCDNFHVGHYKKTAVKLPK